MSTADRPSVEPLVRLPQEIVDRWDPWRAERLRRLGIRVVEVREPPQSRIFTSLIYTEPHAALLFGMETEDISVETARCVRAALGVAARDPVFRDALLTVSQVGSRAAVFRFIRTNEQVLRACGLSAVQVKKS